MSPDQHTNQELMLDVGDGHQLYVQDWGNPDAKTPIIFLHGGPGGACRDGQKQRFEPAQQRVIFFDQRGAGKSTPTGSIEHNTIDKLIEDIVTLLDHFKLETVILNGGSWGSTLALAFGLKHPERVSAMVLNGIYTASKFETDYLDNGGFKTHYPEVWDAYVGRAPQQHADDPSAYHYAMAFGEDPELAKKSIYAYSELESSLVHLDDRRTPQEYDTFDSNSMKIELHYLKNGCFMPDRYILDNAHKLTMPIWLVQGRYDMVCPPITAYELDKRLPNSTLIMVTAGHVSSDRAIYDVSRTILLQLTEFK